MKDKEYEFKNDTRRSKPKKINQIKSITFTSCYIKIANLILKTIIIKLGTKDCNPFGF
jgi:hypothetical protein